MAKKKLFELKKQFRAEGKKVTSRAELSWKSQLELWLEPARLGLITNGYIQSLLRPDQPEKYECTKAKKVVNVLLSLMYIMYISSKKKIYCCLKGMSLGMSLSNKGEPWYESKYENNELEWEQYLCRSFLSILSINFKQNQWNKIFCMMYSLAVKQTFSRSKIITNIDKMT